MPLLYSGISRKRVGSQFLSFLEYKTFYRIKKSEKPHNSLQILHAHACRSVVNGGIFKKRLNDVAAFSCDRIKPKPYSSDGVGQS